MKTITLISAAASSLLIASTIICGMWISANAVTEPSSMSFHRGIGLSSATLSLITLALLIVALKR